VDAGVRRSTEDQSVPTTPLEQVRAHCLSLPEAVERPSHGAPTFFVSGRRAFVSYMQNHHDDGRIALWCAAPEGMQAALSAADPERFFVPPYVGHRGWIGVRLDRGLEWERIAGVIEEASISVAPSRLIADP
jgi:hypothetical protein